MAPAISRPMTSSSSTSRSPKSRWATVCTLSTPTSPPGAVSIGTDTIEVKSRPRNDSNGRYRGSDSLSCLITTGSRWLATQPEIPCPSGSLILPTSESNGGVAPASVSDRSVSSRTCTKHTSLSVAAVMIRAAAAASGSTPGPLDAALMSSRSRASSRSAASSGRDGGLTGRFPRAVRSLLHRCGR